MEVMLQLLYFFLLLSGIYAEAQGQRLTPEEREVVKNSSAAANVGAYHAGIEAKYKQKKNPAVTRGRSSVSANDLHTSRVQDSSNSSIRNPL